MLREDFHSIAEYLLFLYYFIVCPAKTNREHHDAPVRKACLFQNVLHPFIIRVGVDPQAFCAFFLAILPDDFKGLLGKSLSAKGGRKGNAVYNTVATLFLPGSFQPGIRGVTVQTDILIPCHDTIFQKQKAATLLNILCDHIGIGKAIHPLGKALLSLEIFAAAQNFHAKIQIFRFRLA